MPVLFIILLVLAGMILGGLIGHHFRSRTYHGIIKMVENEGTLIFSLELVSDPELLIYQKEVRFKVVAPNYDDLQSILREEN